MDTALRTHTNIAESFPQEESEKILEYLEKGFGLAKMIFWLTGILEWEI
jgi:hypothetical protein